MTAITVRDVPDDVFAALKVQAAQAGKSLQEYALLLFQYDAAHPKPLVEPAQTGETHGQRAVRRARGSANNPETWGMSTDELMELLRGE
ncbi:MAG: hypothetical protein JO362_00320 [Streptomycetaceae bacterium]|nr:hypothetical protein [Streptomycetaceae bacterium]